MQTVIPQALEQRIESWIQDHREELVGDIVDLVRIKSVSQAGGPEEAPFGEGCRKALDAMLELGGRYGFATGCWRNQVGTVDLGTDGETIGFWGHLDVVPEGENWDFPPYEGIVRDGLVIGRGAQDNKGQTVAVLYVMRCIRELGIPLRHNLRLYLGTNEECGMQDVEAYAAAHPLPPLSIIADSNYPVCFGEKGIITAQLKGKAPLSDAVLSLQGGSAPNVVPDRAQAEIKQAGVSPQALEALRRLLTVEEKGDRLLLTAAGRAGHTAFPQGAVNAVHVLTGAMEESGCLGEAGRATLEFFNRINRDCHGSGLGIECGDGDSGPLTCVGSMLALEEGFPVLTINIRYPVTGDPDWIMERIAAACEQGGFIPRFERVDPAHRFPKEHAAVRILTDSYNRTMGDGKQPFVLAGGTYARKVRNAISFGMGFGSDTPRYMEPYRELFRPGHGGAHGPDECTVVELLLRSIKIYVLGLLELDNLDLEQEMERCGG